MTAAELMDRSIYVYKKSFWPQLAFAAILGIIFFMAFMVASLVAGSAILYLVAISPADSAVIGILLIVGAILLPVYLFWSAAASAGHILLSRQAFYGHKVRLDVGQVPRVAVRVFFTLIAQIIVALPFAGAIALLIYTLVEGAGSLHNAWLAVILGFVLVLVAAYLLLAHLFSLAVAVSVFEQKTFFSALFRSWDLIKGEYWKLLGMRILWFLVSTVLAYSIQGGLSLVSMLVTLLMEMLSFSAVITTSVTLITAMITSLLSFAVAFAAMPLSGVFHATLYFNQRIKKEGLDIEISLGRLSL